MWSDSEEIHQRLLALISSDNQQRVDATAYFDQLKLKPTQFFADLSSVLRDRSSINAKILAVKLFELFYQKQPAPFHERPLLELTLTLYFRQIQMKCLTITKLSGALLMRIDTNAQIDILGQIVRSASLYRQQKKALEFLAEISEEFRVAFPVQTEQYLKSLTFYEPSSEIYVIRILVAISMSSPARQQHLTIEQAIVLYPKAKQQILKYISHEMSNLTIPKNNILKCAQFFSRYCFVETSVKEDIEIVTAWSKLLALVIFAAAASQTLEGDETPILSKEFFRKYLGWVLEHINRNYDSQLIRNQIVSHIAQLTVTGRSYLLLDPIDNLAKTILIPSFDWSDMLEGAFFVLGTFCRLQKFTTRHLIAQLCIDKLSGNTLKSKFGALTYLQNYLQSHQSQQIIRQRAEHCIVELFNQSLTTDEFHQALKVLVSANPQPSSEAILSIIAFIDGSDEDCIVTLNTIMLEEFSHYEFSSESMGMLMSTVQCNYDISSPHTKSQYLQLLTIALSKNALSEITFLELYDILKGIELIPQETVVVDSYCEVWTELLKTHNKIGAQNSSFMRDTWRLLEFFMKHETEDRVAQFMMEMVLFEDQQVRGNLRDLLVQNLPYSNITFYDVQQMLTVLYPTTVAIKGSQILERLAGTKQYYRMYFRLPPTQFLALPTQQFSGMNELKWFLLSVLNFQGKMKHTPLQSLNSIDQLSVQFGRLGLDHPIMEIADRCYQMLLQSTSTLFDLHWLGDWSESPMFKYVKKDYLRWSKERVLQLFRQLTIA